MQSDAIEKALRSLLGDSVGPEGIVITLRRHDEYDALLSTIDSLRSENERLQQELTRMSTYAHMYLSALDDLREARRQLRQLGADTSFIKSLTRNTG